MAMIEVKECSQYKIICSRKLYLVPGCLCKNWFGRIATTSKAVTNETNGTVDAADTNNVAENLTNNICWLNHKLLARRQQLLEKYVQDVQVAGVVDTKEFQKFPLEIFFLAPSSLASEQVRRGCRVLSIPH